MGENDEEEVVMKRIEAADPFEPRLKSLSSDSCTIRISLILKIIIKKHGTLNYSEINPIIDL